MCFTMYPFLFGSYLVLETTNQCNLACVHCAVSEIGHEHHRQIGFLPLPIVHNLFQDLAQTKISFETLILFWLGEPTLHPCFSDIYQIALRNSVRHHIFRNIEIHSNGILLTESLQRTIINSATVSQKIHISLDAQHEDTYQVVKGRTGLQQAQRNIKDLLLRKQEKKSLWPRVVLQYIVGENNHHEVEDFVIFWRDFLSKHQISFRVAAGHVPEGTDVILFFRQLDAPTAERQKIENRIFYETIKKFGLDFSEKDTHLDLGFDLENAIQNHLPCSGFWKSPTIDWKGNVTFCTRDNLLQNRIGNITTTSFSSLWTSSNVVEIRKNVAQGDYTQHPICQDCFIPKSFNHSTILESEIQQVHEFFQTKSPHSPLNR